MLVFTASASPITWFISQTLQVFGLLIAVPFNLEYMKCIFSKKRFKSVYWKGVVGVKRHQEFSCTLACSNTNLALSFSHVWIRFHLDAYHSLGLCASRLVCVCTCSNVWVSVCVFNSGWNGHIIKTSHFTEIPFTPYCLPHCWKIQVIYQSMQATCVLFPMCFYALSGLCILHMCCVHFCNILSCMVFIQQCPDLCC